MLAKEKEFSNEMKKITTDKRRELFKRIMWDYTYTPEQIENIIENEGLGKEKIMMYRKILMSERWYDILEILSRQELREALKEEIITTIWIQSLRANYRHARRILFGEDELSAA